MFFISRTLKFQIQNTDVSLLMKKHKQNRIQWKFLKHLVITLVNFLIHLFFIGIFDTALCIYHTILC